MEYENVDEAIAYQTACKKVKQIANTIKAIRIKYYPNFAKISDDDREAYNRLHAQIDRIAEQNGLTKLKAELIADIEDRFNDGVSQDGNEQEKKSEQSEKILKAFYGAIDAGQQALSEGKLKRALSCQKQANTYMSQLEALDQSALVEIAVHYKREKFASLSLQQEKSEETDWNNFLKNAYRGEDLQKRSQITQEILQQAKEREGEREETESNKNANTTQEMLLET